MLRLPRYGRAAEVVGVCRYGVCGFVIEEVTPWPGYAT